jgi:hypothetical protein
MGSIPWAGPPASLLSPSLSFPIAARHPDVRGAAHRPQPAPTSPGSCRSSPPLFHNSRRCPGPNFFPLSTCRSTRRPPLERQSEPTPSSPSIFFHARLPRLTPSCLRAPPPSADALRPLWSPETIPPDEFGQCVIVSPVSGEGCRPSRVPPPFFRSAHPSPNPSSH